MKNPRADPEYVEQLAEFWHMRRDMRRHRAAARRGQRTIKMRGLRTIVVGVPTLATKVQVCPHGIYVQVRAEPLWFALVATI